MPLLFVTVQFLLFTEELTEAKSHQVSMPKSHKQVVELGFEPVTYAL
jgi:hypothetical protein